MIDLHGVSAVEVRLNGHGPYRLVLDGGANLLALSPRVARDLNLQPVGRDPLGNEVVPIDSLRLGGATFRGLAAALDPFLDGKDEDGVLGVNVYAGLLVTLDGPAGRLKLEKGSLPPPDGREILPLTGSSGAEPSVILEIAGRREEALVDTGAAAGLVIPEARVADAGRGREVGDAPAAPGQGLLRCFVVTLDQANRRIRFVRAEGSCKGVGFAATKS